MCYICRFVFVSPLSVLLLLLCDIIKYMYIQLLLFLQKNWDFMYFYILKMFYTIVLVP